MSGGSWDYLYSRVEAAAERLRESKCPHRRALGARLDVVAKALHAVEWVDSCDWGDGDEIAPIREALGESADAAVLAELIAEAKRLRDELAEFMVGMDRRRDEGGG